MKLGSRYPEEASHPLPMKYKLPRRLPSCIGQQTSALSFVSMISSSTSECLLSEIDHCFTSKLFETAKRAGFLVILLLAFIRFSIRYSRNLPSTSEEIPATSRDGGIRQLRSKIKSGNSYSSLNSTEEVSHLPPNADKLISAITKRCLSYS